MTRRPCMWCNQTSCDGTRHARAVYGAPPPPVNSPCRYCDGQNKAPRGMRACFECLAVADDMPALGLAIAAFVRRARVAELEQTVLVNATDWCIACTREDFDKVPRFVDAMKAALAELAALAMEGTGR